MAQHLREIERILVQAVRDTVGQVEVLMGGQQFQQQGQGDINAGGTTTFCQFLLHHYSQRQDHRSFGELTIFHYCHPLKHDH